MFEAKIYTERRKKLKNKIESGLVLILGNSDASMNYPGNIYQFRQDSSFLYFFGLDHPNFAGVIDIDNDKEYIFGNDVDLDDIIWMGPQKTIKENAKKVGIENTAPFAELNTCLNEGLNKGKKIHFLPQYRAKNKMLLSELIGISTNKLASYKSEELIKAVVDIRSVKEECEIEELEKAIEIGYEMHTTSMKMAKAGTYEREIAGRIEGIALSHGGMVSFPVILSQNGETLHNHYHGNKLEEGKLMLTDAGAETPMHYACDFTRTVPVGGKFTQKQKEIYEIVLNANLEAIKAIRPGISYKSIHLLACRVIANGLKELGLMKGNTARAVEEGAHAMFMPHGLGHMMGLDVHDMEDLGEDYVGYDEHIKRSDLFGTAYLRLGRTLQTGFVLTVEPGIYFIPELIDRWKAENKFSQYINYDKVEEYKNFGGIRIEDDILVTENGYKVLGKAIPKTVAEIEELMSK